MALESLHVGESNQGVEESPVERRVRIRFELQQQVRLVSEQLNDAQETFNAIVSDIIATDAQIAVRESDGDAWMRLQFFKSGCQKELEVIRGILDETNQTYHSLIAELLRQQENMYAPMGVCEQVFSFLPDEKPREETILTLVTDSAIVEEQAVGSLTVSEAA